jgi:HEAT repeat protein
MKDSSPSALRDLCEELRNIGTRPSTAGRIKLEEALSSKWDGVRVEAAKALSQWGDSKAVEALKRSLADIASKPIRWSATGAIARTLYPHLQPSDLDWAVDLLLHGSLPCNRHAIAMLFEAFHPDKVRKRLTARLSSVHGGVAEATLRSAIARAEWRSKSTDTQPQIKRDTNPPRRKGWLGRPTSPARGKKRPL